MSASASASREGARLVVWAMGWTLGTRYGGKLVNLATTIVLAWLLTKEDFGLAGYALIFVTFIEILEGFGVESALVYHKEDETLRNNAFWISALSGIGIASLVYFTAPIAGLVFDDERAVPLVQLLSLAFVFTGLRIVPKALLIRRMEFRLMAVPEFVKVIVKGTAAISLALFGFGPWSMIASVVVALAAEAAALWLVAGWRPNFRFVFRGDKIRPLLGYGGGMIGLSIIGTLTTNIDYVLVGRMLGASALGVYLLGFRLPTLLMTPLISALSGVLFPFSVRQNTDPAAMVEGWKHALRYLSIVTVPVGLGIAAVSPALVPLLFGEKWIEAIPVVSAIAVQTVLLSLMWHTGDIYKATGRIRLLFWLGVAQLLVTAPLLYVAVTRFESVGAVAWAHVIGAALTAAFRLWVMAEVMSVAKRTIAGILLHPLLAGALMAAAVVALDARLAGADLAPWWRLGLDVALGALVYGALALALMRRDIVTAYRQLRPGRARQDP